jgi:hypothetical protein
MIKLFVAGFSLDTDEMQLATLFAMHGDISTIKIVRDKKTRLVTGMHLSKWPTEPVLKMLNLWMAH